MRHPCKECGLTYRYAHDLEEHGRVGHVQSSTGPTWSDKDVEPVEAPVEAAPEAEVELHEAAEVAPEPEPPEVESPEVEPEEQPEEPPIEVKPRRSRKSK
jgi:hypothetical protein